MELDPLFFRVNVTAARIYIWARNYKKAEEQLLESIQLDPNLPLAHYRLGKLHMILGRYDDAIIELEKSIHLAQDSTDLPVLAQAYALKGNNTKARRLLNIWLNSKSEYISPTEVALVYLALGEKEHTFKWLETAYEHRDWKLFRLKIDPRYDPIRNDQRYIDLLNKVGIKP